MPFVQMENISHFLRACKAPPLNLQEHDMFLTVDLYESKDPAQVLQCLGAFSRAATNANPSKFPNAIGPRVGGLSPQRTGTPGLLSPTPTSGSRPRGLSNSSNASSAYNPRPPLSASKTGGSYSGRWSPTKSPTNGPKSPSVSSWSSRAHEGVTSPAWNIAQYGYMGGANQNNLGIAFGGRRQITSAGPHVPSLAEKQKMRKEKEAEAEKLRQEEEERLQLEEEKAQQEEQRRWEEETRRKRDEEARRVAEEKRRWEEEERQWKMTEEKRRREEEEAEKRLIEERAKARSKGDSRLQGQFLSQYQAERPAIAATDPNQRIMQLEAELERARQREAAYERGRLQPSGPDAKARARSRSRPRPSTGTPSRQDSWARGDDSDGEGLRQSRGNNRPLLPPRQNSRPLPDPMASATPPAMVKAHRTGEGEALTQVKTHSTGGSSRPLPDPRAYSSPPRATPSPKMTRTDRFLASNPAPVQQQVPPTYSRELGATAERDAEDRRRAQAQQRTKAGGWASKSLLEREMEMERQRQREWEESQKETAKAARSTDGVEGIGGGVGGRWDVGQWAGFTGGDNQNRGAQGIGAGRRQIVGPRPLPGTPGPR